VITDRPFWRAIYGNPVTLFYCSYRNKNTE